ncbi:hypothetical protein EV284_6402 [Streptomyces sp. BK022]|uniref:hypothetical protein n=1 Tax=Streptomyces sp. BK022 TaxID=2512123 RepID=UPI00102A07E1|nr:hypothetical protein [Streptomyces sp. BK022]RZU28236.1 hypothetical protein EV284_6402 [Streptomyces sp. BK022]
MASTRARAAAAELRNRARAARELRTATKAVATGTASASNHLMAGGVTPLVAHNYAATLTRKTKSIGRTPLASRTIKKRPGKKGLTVSRTGDLARMKRHRVVPVALWTLEDLRALALSGFRPKNTQVADFLAALALGRPAARAAA